MVITFHISPEIGYMCLTHKAIKSLPQDVEPQVRGDTIIHHLQHWGLSASGNQ